MSREPLFVGVDIGTTAVKCIVMTYSGAIRASASRGYSISALHPGWIEQDPEDWWAASCHAIQACVRETGADGIQGVSFAGQMSAPVLLDEAGRPLGSSILVADTRTSEQTAFLRERYRDAFVYVSGNEPLDAFAVSKLLWLKEHSVDRYRKARAVIFPKDFIRFRITGDIASDPTDAGNSLLYDRRSGGWRFELITELGLDPLALFPPLRRSSERVGVVSAWAEEQTGLRAGTPVVTGAADMACSQLGTGALDPGTVAITIGTSAQVLSSVGEPISELLGKVTFHPSAVPGAMYAMGSVFTGGLGVHWGYRLLCDKDVMGASDYTRLEELTREMEAISPGSRGLLFIPFLVGSGTPYFDARDRAAWLGLSLGQDKALLLHSIMEGISYNIRENVAVLEAAHVPVEHVRIGGGGSRNAVWCRMIGDVVGKDVSRLSHRDASALGAALLAGVGSGFYPSIESAVDSVVRASQSFAFSPERHGQYDRLFQQYLGVYESANRYYREACRGERSQ